MTILSNEHLRVEIDETCGCDILSVRAAQEQPNLLDKRGWQTWLKRGTVRDRASGVLSNFFPHSRTAPYEIREQSETSLVAAWRAESGLEVEKTIRLSGDCLDVEVSIRNNGQDQSAPLQLEHFILWGGGALDERASHRTQIIGENGTHEIRLENFAQRYVSSFAFQNRRIEISGARGAARLCASPNSQCAVAVVFAKTQARGFTSLPFQLAPGESFSHSVQLRLLPDAQNEKQPQPLASSSTRDDLLKSFAGEPVFQHRWSHLCLQYDRVEIADLEKIVSQLLVPLRYTGVIFEVDRGVRLDSHPELAEDWALRRDELVHIVGFCRAHGLEVGLEWNTPGHQNETNLLLAHPHLAEDPAILDRPPLCVSHPDSRRIVGDVIKELVEVGDPDLFFFGADEVQFAGNGATIFARCPLCRGQKPADLFGEWTQFLAGLLPPNVTPVIFGDMYLPGTPNSPGNGDAGEVWRALEQLPKHVEISDWHYYPQEKYPSLDLFLARGHEVWPSVAFNLEGIATFADAAQTRGIDRLLHTTWAVPNQEKLPLESVIWAALYAWHGRAANELPVRDWALGFSRTFW